MSNPATFGSHSDWVRGEDFQPIDRALGALIGRLDAGGFPEIPLAAALLSRARADGDVCLPLASLAARFTDARPALPADTHWLQRLRASRLVGAPGDFKPLILDAANRLYLHRLHEDERHLTDAIQQRAAAAPISVDSALFRSACEKHLGRRTPGADGIDRQRVAACAALTRRLTLITGGPGTGKTHTAGGIITMGIELGLLAPGRIALAAPTGKAAARLEGKITEAFERAAASGLVPPQEYPRAKTLHRLLGASADGLRFRHDAAHPLACDFLLVDEASMVDQMMMARLFLACPPQARIVLLGDPNQLASVEAGSVLADLCAGARECPADPDGALAASTGESLPAGDKTTAPLADCRVHLNINHRAEEGAGLIELAQHIHDGESAAALEWIQNPGRLALAMEPLPAASGLMGALLQRVRQVFDNACAMAQPEAALEALSRFKILCALRQGPFGATAINQRLEQSLRPAGSGQWYKGRPVLITRNDYGVRLFNGDLGIAWPDSGGKMRVWFSDTAGPLRGIDPGRLPAHDTAFALTVHQSQGSEFDEVLVVLPDRPAPVLTRELVYTGVTRARRRVTVMSPPDIFSAAIKARTCRVSGLRAALWGD